MIKLGGESNILEKNTKRTLRQIMQISNFYQRLL